MDPEIVALSERQHGLVALWQLVAAGWTRASVRWAVRQRRLLPVAPRVFAVGHRPDTDQARFLAAVLRAGPDAVLSHQSAARLWGLLRAIPVVHVTTPGAVRSRPGVLHVHRSVVSGADRTTRDGIPVTTIPRTLVDLADVLDPAQLVRAVEHVRHLDVSAMRRCLDRHPGRHANGALADLLDVYDPRTRSPLEDIFLAMCRDHAIPQPDVNAVIAGAERDFSWPDVRLVIESDGGAFHAGRVQRNADSRRDVDLGIAGWRVHRLTYERVVLDPVGSAAAVRALRAAYP